MTQHPAGEFRQDLNGLRALAVLSVLLFHFEVPAFTGGFVGVDVFFVLSGYLMTRIVWDGLRAGRFRFLDFYLRRLARIWPALLAMGAALLVLGWFVLLPTDYQRLSREIVEASAFFVNFSFAGSTGYFAAAPVNSWLLHCWSLAVEFQFYVLYPAFLWAAWRLGRERGVALALVGLTAVSMGVSFLLTRAEPMAAFYLLPARAWEFSAGGLAMLLRSPSPRWRTPMALAGIALVLCADLGYSASLAYPSLYAGVPVLGAVLVIVAASRTVLLANPVAQFLGTISYSLYLWHWPVVVLAGFTKYGHGALQLGVLLSISLLLGWSSFRFIETPFRRVFQSGFTMRRWQLGTFAGMLLGAVIAVGAMDGIPARIPEPMLDLMAQARHGTEFRDGRCFLGETQGFDDLAPECLDPPGPHDKPVLALWGDSLAAHLYPGIAAQPWASDYRIVQITASACSAAVTLPSAARPHCQDIQKRAQAFILQLRPAILVLAANDNSPLDESTFHRLLIAMAKGGIPAVKFVGPLPRWRPNPAPTVFFESLLHPDAISTTAVPQNAAYLLERERSYRATVQGAGADFISISDRLCHAGRCQTVVDGVRGASLLQFDEVHLTTAGSDWVAAQLIGPALGHAVTQRQRITVAFLEPLAFHADAPGAAYLTRGWMSPEGWGAWTAFTSLPGVIKLPIEIGRSPSVVRVEFWGQLGPRLEREKFAIRLSGSRDRKFTVDLEHPVAVEDLVLSAEEKARIATTGVVSLEFRAKDGKSPKAMGLNDDERVLGLGIRKITLIP